MATRVGVSYVGENALVLAEPSEVALNAGSDACYRTQTDDETRVKSFCPRRQKRKLSGETMEIV